MNTPAPWSCLKSVDRLSNGTTAYILVGTKKDGHETLICTAECEADAKHIELCVNMHDVMTHFIRALYDDGHVPAETVEYARDILEAAGNL